MHHGFGVRFDSGKVIGTAFKGGWCKGAIKELVCGVAYSTKGINSEGHVKKTLLAKRMGKGGGGFASVLVGILGARKLVTLFVKVTLNKFCVGSGRT